MPSLFTITATNTRIRLDGSRHGETSFTVTNTSGRPVRGRARLAALGTTASDWLALDGQAERNFDTAGTQQFTVQITVPADVPAGENYLFRLDMLGVDNPDEDFTEGPAVAIIVPAGHVPPPPPEEPKGYVTTLVGAIIGLLAGTTAGFILGLIFAAVFDGFRNPITGTIAVILLALGPLLGQSLGAFVALRTNRLSWPRETGIITGVGVIVLGGLDLLLLSLLGSANAEGPVVAIVLLLVILPIFMLGPGLIARAIVRRWKAGAF